MRRKKVPFYISLAILLIASSCHKEVFVTAGTGLTDWTFASHSGLAIADYGIVFDQTKVNRMDFVLDSDDWDIMQDNLTDIVGQSTGGGGQGGGQTFSEETPVYVKAQMYFNGKQWYDVGIRYKGNSSLSASTGKLPFRLKMNQYENENLAITNQKFYGFQELSLSSNFNDASFLREKVACDLFREGGVKAPQTAFYEVYVDHGDGPTYFGLYTFVEVVDDNMIKTQFGGNSGNIYKPDGDAASFKYGTYDISELEKKNNTASNWSDIESLYTILNSTNRLNNPEVWKADLENVLDVNQFLKWLAINTTIQNWDTYGNMTHNYYLYVNHKDGRFNWIPWDNNEAFQDGKQSSTLPFNFSTTTNGEWPLIQYLYAQAEYKAIYDGHIQTFINTVFVPSSVQAKYDFWKNMISESVSKEVSGYTFLTSYSSFESAITTLKTHVTSRVNAANAYL
jgi:hypothetical protein